MSKRITRTAVVSLVAAVISLSILSPSFATTSHSKPIVVTAKKPQFLLTLPANPTTGYMWVLQGNYNSALIRPVKHTYQAANQKLIGAPGTDVWIFKVQPLAFKVPTQLRVVLNYRRIWEKTAAQTKTFQIITD